jgi:hypothetical protein
MFEITCELQLFAERATVPDCVGLIAFFAPDFARGCKQFFYALRGDEQTAIVIGKNYVTRLHFKIAEPIMIARMTGSAVLSF